jgi:hypothetical protein
MKVSNDVAVNVLVRDPEASSRAPRKYKSLLAAPR